MATETPRSSLKRLLFVLVAASLWLASCGGPAAQAGAPVATVAVAELGAEVAPGTVAQLNDAGDIVVIDVREPDEYAAGHIPGATLIPLGTLPDRLAEVPTDQPVVLVCRSGNRSGQAYNFLKDQGFDNVHNMTGGMIDWEALGLTVEK